ncbi:hypothetical protein RF11_00271 [Thelohanellus kitauei]|uniref:Uncharacterized protein n=1 Tax=Thelohanellus kitauei TaxID=669202 RepID=A0A0C2JQM4_THEKT|nr:hypothetical protein RF11_00271 [Thelohanellus kitauei]
MRLSTFGIEEHQVFTPLTTIHDLRKDLEIDSIRSLMINAFDLTVPNDLKCFFLISKGCPSVTKEEHEKVLSRCPQILQEAKICFIKSCVECRLKPVARYRVWVITYMNGRTCENRKSGFPETLSVSFVSLEFDRENSTYLIIPIKKIAGVVVSEIEEKFASVTIFSTENAVFFGRNLVHDPENSENPL